MCEVVWYDVAWPSYPPPLSLPLSRSLSLSLALSHTHIHTLSLTHTLSHPHTYTPSPTRTPSPSHTHPHTHTHTLTKTHVIYFLLTKPGLLGLVACFLSVPVVELVGGSTVHTRTLCELRLVALLPTQCTLPRAHLCAHGHTLH